MISGAHFLTTNRSHIVQDLWSMKLLIMAFLLFTSFSKISSTFVGNFRKVGEDAHYEEEVHLERVLQVGLRRKNRRNKRDEPVLFSHLQNQDNE